MHPHPISVIIFEGSIAGKWHLYVNHMRDLVYKKKVWKQAQKLKSETRCNCKGEKGRFMYLKSVKKSTTWGGREGASSGPSLESDSSPYNIVVSGCLLKKCTICKDLFVFALKGSLLVRALLACPALPGESPYCLPNITMAELENSGNVLDTKYRDSYSSWAVLFFFFGGGGKAILGLAKLYNLVFVLVNRLLKMNGFFVFFSLVTGINPGAMEDAVSSASMTPQSAAGVSIWSCTIWKRGGGVLTVNCFGVCLILMLLWTWVGVGAVLNSVQRQLFPH